MSCGIFQLNGGKKPGQKVLLKITHTGRRSIFSMDPHNAQALAVPRGSVTRWQAQRRGVWGISGAGQRTSINSDGFGRTRHGRRASWKGSLPTSLASGRIGRLCLRARTSQFGRLQFDRSQGRQPASIAPMTAAARTGRKSTETNGDRNAPGTSRTFSPIQRAWIPCTCSTLGCFARRTHGKTLEVAAGASMVIHHGLWIDPKKSAALIQRNDGGRRSRVAVGKTWTTQENQPTRAVLSCRN